MGSPVCATTPRTPSTYSSIYAAVSALPESRREMTACSLLDRIRGQIAFVHKAWIWHDRYSLNGCRAVRLRGSFHQIEVFRAVFKCGPLASEWPPRTLWRHVAKIGRSVKSRGANGAISNRNGRHLRSQPCGLKCRSGSPNRLLWPTLTGIRNARLVRIPKSGIGTWSAEGQGLDVR